MPQTMFSASRKAVPHTMFSQLSFPQVVPHTMFSASRRVPHTMFSPTLAVPHTMFSPRAVPHTMFPKSSVDEPHTMFPNSSDDVPQTMFSPSRRSVPHTMFSPPESRDAPQTVLLFHAFAAGRRTPDSILWLAQMMDLLHARCVGYRLPGLRGCVEPRQIDRAAAVQEAGAFGQRVVVLVLRRVFDDGLHQVRRQLRVRLNHQRGGARNDRARPCWCRSG